MRFTKLTVFIVLVTALAGTPAVAQNKISADEAQRREQAKKLFEQGRASFEAGKFDDALRAYAAAYKLVPLAGLLFNIGQCYRNLGQLEQAIKIFKAFVKGAPTAPNLPAVKRLIAALEAQLAAQSKKSGTSKKLADDLSLSDVPSTATPATATPAKAAPEKRQQTDTKKNAAEKQSPADNRTQTPSQILADEPGGAAAGTPAVAAALKHTQKQQAVKPKPLYKKWWFWTLVTTAAAGAITGIYYASRTRDADIAPSRFPTWVVPSF